MEDLSGSGVELLPSEARRGAWTWSGKVHPAPEVAGGRRGGGGVECCDARSGEVLDFKEDFPGQFDAWDYSDPWPVRTISALCTICFFVLLATHMQEDWLTFGGARPNESLAISVLVAVNGFLCIALWLVWTLTPLAPVRQASPPLPRTV